MDVCTVAPREANAEYIALQRYAALIRQQAELIEILKIYSPEELIQHMKMCGALLEKNAILTELLGRHTVEEIQAAVESRDRLREQQKRYYEENKTRIIKRNAAYMKGRRDKSKEAQQNECP